MKNAWYIGILCAGLMSSCLKDELPIPARPQGEVLTGQACLGSDYGDQLWYDLSSNSVVSTNSKNAWDLAFECDANGWRVRLNTSRFMRAAALPTNDITQPADTVGLAALWRIDQSDGSPDSTAIGDWHYTQPVYAIEMGFSDIGLPLGVKLLRITSVDAGSFTCETANLNGTNTQQFVVPKDPIRSYVHFKISTGQVVDIAPPKGAYDLVFTQYTYQFYEPYTAYLVTGAINAFSGSRVAPMIASDFGAVALADTIANPFTVADDAVGYDWKEYDFDLATYTVLPERVYIIEDSQGQFFKLHFTDFYNDQGERGCPTFEVVAL